jgi:hypothetical protein
MSAPPSGDAEGGFCPDKHISPIVIRDALPCGNALRNPHIAKQFRGRR